MTMYTGVVEEISTRNVETKYGTKPTYTFKVNGTWVKHGFKDPRVNIGDTVSFDGVEGKYGMETKAVTIVTGGAPTSLSIPMGTPVSVTRTSYPSKDKVFPIPALHGDRSIVRQNALARATELWIAQHGGKSFDALPTIPNQLIALARHFEAYTAGDLDMEEAMAETSTINKVKESALEAITKSIEHITKGK